MKNKFITLLLIFIIIITFFVPLSFANSIVEQSNNSFSNLKELNLSGESCILIDANYGKILYDKNCKDIRYPASTTKLMTALVVFEHCPDLSEMVNISYYSVHSIPYTYSIANLQVGEQVSLKDLLYSLLVASANDAAYSLAEYVANNGNNYLLDSSEEAKNNFESSISIFADMMNSKAQELGCQNTHFVNPNGIHDENHYSTAYDLSLIGKYAYSNTTIMQMAKTLSYTVNNSSVYTGEPRVMYATNILLKPGTKYYYQYANGLKTGYTDPAQSCIIASASKDVLDLIAVVLHSDDTVTPDISREDDCINLFEYGFNNYSNIPLVEANSVVDKINIFNGTKDTKSLNVLSKDTLSSLLPVGTPIDVTPEIRINKYFAPIQEGEVIGTITYTLDDNTYSSDLIAEHSVTETYSMDMVFLAFALLAVILVLYTLIKTKSKVKNKSKTKKRKK